MSTSPLIASTRAELSKRRGDWPALCRATGMTYWWLTKFAQGRIREPGVSKIETLQAHFRANPVAGDPVERAPARAKRAGRRKAQAA